MRNNFHEELTAKWQSGVDRSILKLAVPSIVTNITTPLLALMDVTVAGHMGAPVYIAAIAVGGSMFNMLYWLFGFLRMGSSGMTAQAYGGGDTRATSTVLRQALTVALSVGLMMIALQTPLCRIILRFMDTDPTTTAIAERYFRILIWGAPPYLATFALSGWFLGMQDSRVTMWVSILINVVNIAATLSLVYLLHMGIDGIATGTLIAQWTGFVAMLAVALRRHGLEGASWRDTLHLPQLRRFFKVNTDIFLRTVCLVAVTMWFTRIGAIQGERMLAVNALLMQFFTLFSYFMDGFAFAGEALTGRYIGAADHTMLRRSIRALLKWGAFMAVIFSAAYLLGGDILLRLLSSDRSITASAHDYLLWTATVPIAGFLAFTWDGIFIGATATRRMLLSMLAATAAFFLVESILFPHLANHGLWLAFLSYLLVRGLILTLLSRRL
ncbi:MATE family efflux transporter [uncultured Muribaculum sp.]|uniref:MATE family efflux transporter n=1 Tax=uncultured Muribaculum sp. TaxID=1918613 RepID=UPI0025F39635|nr:MATE family efflux transporter [uncultured Muribaculum sp.]